MTGAWFLKFATIFLLSSVKFIFAVPASKIAGLTYQETIYVTISGGIFGVTSFLFLSKYAYELIIFIKKFNFLKKPQILETKKVIFSKKSRMIVHFISKYGLAGIAFLTPILLSIPIGTIVSGRICQRFRKHLLKAWIFLSLGVVFWSFLISRILFQII